MFPEGTIKEFSIITQSEIISTTYLKNLEQFEVLMVSPI